MSKEGISVPLVVFESLTKTEMWIYSVALHKSDPDREFEWDPDEFCKKCDCDKKTVDRAEAKMIDKKLMSKVRGNKRYRLEYGTALQTSTINLIDDRMANMERTLEQLMLRLVSSDPETGNSYFEGRDFLTSTSANIDHLSLTNATMEVIGMRGIASSSVEDVCKVSGLTEEVIADLLGTTLPLDISAIFHSAVRHLIKIIDSSLTIEFSGDAQQDLEQLVNQYWQMFHSSKALVPFLLESVVSARREGPNGPLATIWHDESERSVKRLAKLYRCYYPGM